MNWYEGYLIGKIVAEERIAPRRHYSTDCVVPWRNTASAPRALMSWLF